MEIIKNSCQKSCVDLLISIHPVYVEQIVAGTKRFEFRRSIFKKEVNKIFVYSTAPIKKVIGYIRYSGYLKGSVEEIWEHCKSSGGINEGDFFRYFKGKDSAYAIKVDSFFVFKKPVPLTVFAPSRKLAPPQSFLYLEETDYEIYCNMD